MKNALAKDRDPSDMALEEVIAAILRMSPRGLGSQEHAESNLEALDRDRLNEMFLKLRGEHERTQESAEASWARYQQIYAERQLGTKAASRRGLKRMIAARESIKADRQFRREPALNSAFNPAHATDTVRNSGSSGIKVRRYRSARGLPSFANLLTVAISERLSNKVDEARGAYLQHSGIVNALSRIEKAIGSFHLDSKQSKHIEHAVLESRLVNTYLDFQLPSMIRDVWSLIARDNIFAHSRLSHMYGENLSHQMLMPSDLWIERSVLDPVFLSKGPSFLIETKAIESLVKLSMAAAEYKPTTIVSLSAGGFIIAKFLAEQATESTVVYEINDTNNQKDNILENEIHLINGSKVLLVDDVLASSQSMYMARDWLLSKATAIECRAVALVSSVDAINQLEDSWIYTSTVTPSPTIELPWGNKGGYLHTDDAHVFGHGSGKTFPIANELYERVSKNLQTMSSENEI